MQTIEHGCAENEAYHSIPSWITHDDHRAYQLWQDLLDQLPADQ